MTEPVSIFDQEDPDIEEMALREAEAQADAGKLIDHADVAIWLDELAKGNRVSPPKCG